MNIGIIGLGLIGGSLAKALKKYTNHYVYGQDILSDVCQQAIDEDSIDEILTPATYHKCQVILVALYPHLAIDVISSHVEDIAKGTLVVDCCGVKQSICTALWPLAKQYGYFHRRTSDGGCRKFWLFCCYPGTFSRGIDDINP